MLGRKTVKFQDKLIFTKHLSTMVKAGIPITEALDSLSTQQKTKYFNEVLTDIKNEVENGKSLGVSFKKYENVFSNFFISLVEVGEESGSLEENLEYLTEQMEKDYSLRKKIKAALIYPGVIVSAALIIGSFVSLFVLPKLVDFFEAFDTELPFTTKILLGFANLMKHHGFLIIALTVLFFIGLSFLVKQPSIRYYWHKLQLKLPIVGKLILYGQLSRFSRNLGTLIARGVALTRAFEVTVETMSNDYFKKDLKLVAKGVAEGKEIGTILSKKRFDTYPPLVYRMIAVGEKTGKLDETLIYLSEFYDDEVEDISKNLSTVLEPIMLLIIGVIVGFLALAIITPIYDLSGSIRR